MNFWDRPIISDLSLDPSNNTGINNFQNFLASLREGNWIFPRGWINIINYEDDQGEWGVVKNGIIALYFNNKYDEASVIESDTPVSYNFPEELPDAYISWDKYGYKIWQVYVKPEYRDLGIATNLVLLSIIYLGQRGSILGSPDTSTNNFIGILDDIQRNYGVLFEKPNVATSIYKVYSPFYEIDFAQAEELFAVD